MFEILIFSLLKGIKKEKKTVLMTTENTLLIYFE